MVRQLARAAAVCMVLMGTPGINAAQAQIVPGEGRLTFGVFAQGAFLGIDNDVNGPVTASESARPAGFSYGATAGYDRFFSNGHFAGIELDLSLGEVTHRFATSRVDMDYLVSLRGRYGMHISDDWIGYVTGGVAFLGLENASNPFVAGKTSASLTGGIIGVGVEKEYRDFTIFGEYLFAGFRSWEFARSDGAYQVSGDIHMLRAGVKFTTGHDHYHEDERHWRDR